MVIVTEKEAIAREAIRQLLAVYNTEGDRARFDGLAACFTEDGVLETGEHRFEGRAAIRTGLGPAARAPANASARAPAFVRHNLTTSRVDFVSETCAQGWTYFVVFTDIGPDHMGTYIDRFMQIEGRWLIAHRRAKTHWWAEASYFRVV